MGVLKSPSKVVGRIRWSQVYKALGSVSRHSRETQQAAAFIPITIWFGRRGMLNEEVLPILGAGRAKIFSAKILGP